MTSKRNLLLCLPIGMMLLVSCSTAKKTTTARNASKHEKAEGKDREKGDKVEFIDDITISRNAKTTEHRYNGRNNKSSSKASLSGTGIEGAKSWQFKYAQLLDVAVEELSNERLFGFIEEWWGAPYRLGGNTRNGVDCSNFVNIMMLQVFSLSTSGNAAALYNTVKKLGKKDDLKTGDMVFFRINRKYVSHVGIYLDNHRFVHASTSSGVMISDLGEPYWAKYYAGAGRLD